MNIVTFTFCILADWCYVKLKRNSKKVLDVFFLSEQTHDTDFLI